MDSNDSNATAPMILAPAGNKDAFLAAVAAGADAVYCGLKQYSARMEAKNFTLEQMTRMIRFAHDKDVKVYLALNSLLKPGDMRQAARLLKQLSRYVKPDALIIQDLSIIELAKQTGYQGEIHLSTLANVSFPKAVQMAGHSLGIKRVVIPRELHVDEIKKMAKACPGGVDLEIFIHGALCYGISGRCYWSSFLGGKSGLRGQCVQPCRRQYTQNKQSRKFFSCRDLSLDVLVKVLREIPKIRAWKIEGRKKGPHYVYYTTYAYRLLRDQGKDPQTKKTAIGLLERALGRPGTHFFFLPQRPYNPIDTSKQTGSGLFIGKTQGGGKPFLNPRESLLPGDLLRVGYESENWHRVLRINKHVPKKGRFNLKADTHKNPPNGTPVFLIDRREKALLEMISGLDKTLKEIKLPKISEVGISLRYPKRYSQKRPAFEMTVHRKLTKKRGGDHRHERRTDWQSNLRSVWISAETEAQILKIDASKIWHWLPPVVWPDEEQKIAGIVRKILKKGGKYFVLNAPWQIALFDNPGSIHLWAGPFCNISNSMAVNVLKSIGYKGVIVSPELTRKDYIMLPQESPLPLGIVISGNWPFCLSRFVSSELKPDIPFVSPKKEEAWAVQHESCVWIYPNWKLDIRPQKERLLSAGYQLFVHLSEPVPNSVKLKKRPGMWNWGLDT